MANKSFMVVDGELRLQITPCEGWYAVEGLDIPGLCTQGRTIEEAIYMAHDAAECLAVSRAKMAAEKAAKAKATIGKTAKGKAIAPKRPKSRQMVKA